MPLIQKRRRGASFNARIDVALPGVVAVAIIALCTELPFKYVDRNRVELNSDCVTVGELARLLNVRNFTPA